MSINCSRGIPAARKDYHRLALHIFRLQLWYGDLQTMQRQKNRMNAVVLGSNVLQLHVHTRIKLQIVLVEQ